MSRMCNEQDRRACSFALWQIGIAGMAVGWISCACLWVFFEFYR